MSLWNKQDQKPYYNEYSFLLQKLICIQMTMCKMEFPNVKTSSTEPNDATFNHIIFIIRKIIKYVEMFINCGIKITKYHNIYIAHVHTTYVHYCLFNKTYAF